MASKISTGRPQWSQLMPVESYLLPIVPDELYNRASVLDGAKGQEKLFEPIFFQFLPTLTGDDETANYDEVGGDIIGRAEGFSIYKNSASRTITLQTNFAALDREDYNPIWVQQQVYRLKALTKPIYDRDELFKTVGRDSIYYAPPMCIFSYGYRYVNIPVVIQSVTATVPDDAAITPIDALPIVMDVQITMKVNYPYGYVPGYLNFARLYNTTPGAGPSSAQNTWNPGQVSWLGDRVSLPQQAKDVTSNYFNDSALINSGLRSFNTFITEVGTEVG